MTRILLIFFMFCTLPAAAQEVAVRSGEHEDFTRFVFYLPEGVEPRVMPLAGRVRISLSRKDVVYNLGAAFDRIGRNRITDLRDIGGGALDMVMACDCGARTDRLPGNLLVVDITGRDDARPGRPRLRYAASLARQDGTAFAGGLPLVMPELFTEANPEPAGSRAADGAEPRPKPPMAEMPPTLPDLSDPSTARRAARVAEAERTLLRNLARAATQGLLDASVTNESSTVTTVEERPGSQAGLPPGDAPAEPILRSETSVDRAYRQAADTPPVTADGDSCLPDRYFALSTWRGEHPFGVQLGAHRSRLYSERDVSDPGAALDLVRFYISHGFGSEALQVLSEVPSGPQIYEILESMARIIDNGHDSVSNAFDDQADCASDVAFWAVMSMDPLPKDLSFDSEAVLRTVDSLPPDLRRHLGPILAGRLTEQGSPAIAERILRLVDRGLDVADAGRDLAHARLLLKRGDQDEAEVALEQVGTRNDPLSPEALAMLIESRVAAGLAIEPETTALAEAYAAELRGQPTGAPAARAAALALASSGHPEEALDRIDVLRGETGFDWAETRSLIASMIAANSDDLEFLRLARRLAEADPHELNAANANDVGERLAMLGFGATALPILSGPAQGDEARRRRLIRARIALDDRRPRRAEAELAGLEGEDVARLRAEATSQSGDHAAALAAFAELDDGDRALREAWRAGDWDRVAETSDGILADAATLMAGEAASGPSDPPVTEDSTGVLSRNREMLERSRSARDTLDALLQATELSDEASEATEPDSG